MKALKIAVILILVLNGGYSLYNWLFTEEPAPVASVALPAIEPAQAAEGLDLKALITLGKEIRSGQELERRLNEKNGINNLDLNDDEKVDYIFVSEYGNSKDKMGYSLSVEPVAKEVQEVATLEVELNGERAELQVIGNEQIYGDQAIYNDSTTVEREQSAAKVAGANGTPMYNSYFYPRPMFMSPFYFGFYPAYYAFFPLMSRPMYVSQVTSYRSNTVQGGRSEYQNKSNKQISSPNKGKTANKGISRSLRKPTKTQKQFQVTQSKNLKSGGFGRGKSSTSQLSTKSGTSKQLGTSRGSGSFGSARNSTSFGSSSTVGSTRSGSSVNSRSTTGSSFGSSQRKSTSFGSSSNRSFGSSSVRSGSSRSRSFSFGGK
ncbi:MAG: hypothetical protein COB67_07795 [SAR324 cluster bacterium]|uniref:Uncharacterized protein n=1 Tax=SAR324 cluster bacterium TaxID=2024889 RepID=A0A2A4T2I7_9DELT|nr:MAG: hypothetical protein COB67_07795 [SAR324 cluster bacterium]